MEDEIDLRQYVDVLVRRWKWIVGITILAALLTGIISFILPPTYEATATVFVLSAPTASSNGAPVLASSQILISPQTQLALLESSDVAQQVAQTLGTELSADEKRALLHDKSVRIAPDPIDKSLFQITAQANTPQKSTDIANAWAKIGVAAINQEQSQALNQSLPLLQQSADAAAKTLQSAEEKLSQMQRDLQINLLTQELSRVQGILNAQVAERENVNAALAQAQTLKNQVQQGQISLSPEMLLNLQTIATASGNGLLIQPSQFAGLSQQQQLDQLSAVIAALVGRQQALSTSITDVSSQAASLQKQLDDKQATLIEPTRARDTARTNYDAATATLRDAQTRLVTRQDPAQAISLAVLPDSPVSPKKTQNVVIAGVLGLLVSVFGVFAAEYLTKPRAS